MKLRWSYEEAAVIDLKLKYQRFIGAQLLTRQYIDALLGAAWTHVNTAVRSNENTHC